MPHSCREVFSENEPTKLKPAELMFTPFFWNTVDYTSHFKTYSPETAIKEISLRVAAEITGLQRMFNSLQPQEEKNMSPLLWYM